MCTQRDKNSEFWKNATEAFLILKRVHSNDGETDRLHWNECPNYRECWLALKVSSQLQTGLSDAKLLSRRVSYQILVRGNVQNDLIKELCATNERVHLIGSYPTPKMRYLNNDEASLTSLEIWSKVRQEAFLITSGNFTSVDPVQWYGGVNRACLLSLPDRIAVVQGLWRLHDSLTEWKVLCPGSEYPT